MTESYTPHPKEASTSIEIRRLSESQNFYEQPPFIAAFALALDNVPIKASDFAYLLTKFVAKREILRQQQGAKVSMNDFFQDVVKQLPLAKRPSYEDRSVLLSAVFKNTVLDLDDGNPYWDTYVHTQQDKGIYKADGSRTKYSFISITFPRPYVDWVSERLASDTRVSDLSKRQGVINVFQTSRLNEGNTNQQRIAREDRQ